MSELIINSALRALLAFVLVLVVTRIIGKKAISEMTFFNFVVSITLGSLTANFAMGADNTALSAGSAIITLAILVIITDLIHTKSYFFRKLVNSEPVVIVQNGEMVKSNMQKSRMTVNDLTTRLREKNAFNIADVEFAILENDGKLSVLPKSQKQPITPADLQVPTSYKGLTKDIIIDGKIISENLKEVDLDEVWLMDQLKSKNIEKVEDVFFAALDTTGNLYVSKGLVDEENIE